MIIAVVLVTILVIILTALFALPAFVSSRKGKNENSLDSKSSCLKRGREILITGPNQSGKTYSFIKLIRPSELSVPPLVHSLKSNTFLNFKDKWTLIDRPMNSQLLHSNPAEFFHFNQLAALILTFYSTSTDIIDQNIEFLASAVALCSLKSVPIAIILKDQNLKEISKHHPNHLFIKLSKYFTSLQNIRSISLLNGQSTISFSDPLNRIIFESVDGETADFLPTLSDFVENKVFFFTDHYELTKWINTLTL